MMTGGRSPGCCFLLSAVIYLSLDMVRKGELETLRKAIGRNRNGRVSRKIVGWLDWGWPRTPAEIWAGPRQEPLLRVDRFSGRGLAEEGIWHRWARVKTSPRLALPLMEHVLLLTFLRCLREHSRRPLCGLKCRTRNQFSPRGSGSGKPVICEAGSPFFQLSANS